MWPFQTKSKQPEKRDGYADALLAAHYAAAQGVKGASRSATSAAEISAGLIGRALASAKVKPDNIITQSLTPGLLNMVGRALIYRGEIAFRISVGSGGLLLLPSQTIQVFGKANPADWEYLLTETGPSNSETFRVPADEVIHIRWGSDPAQPWRGVSPLSAASLTSRMLAETESQLGDEASGPRGSLIPVPTDGGDGGADDPLKMLKADIGKLKGGLALLETTSAGFGEGRVAAPGYGNSDWVPKRLGADPPISSVDLSDQASLRVLSACGIPSALVAIAPGTAAREAFRRFLHVTVAPLLNVVAVECRAKLNVQDLTFDTTELHAADIAGRARAFQSLVGGGMELDQAAGLSGLLIDDD